MIGIILFILISGCDKVADKPVRYTHGEAAYVETTAGKEEQIMDIRESAKAGSWYEGEPKALKREIGKYLSNVKLDDEVKSLRPFSLIVPHAGHQYSGQCAAYGYSLIKDKPFKKVIIIGPSHYVGFRGVSVSKATHYQTPLGLVEIDTSACETLLGNKQLFSYQKAADSEEHSLEIQLPFLQSVLSGYKIVPLIVGEIENYSQTASAINRIIDDKTLLIISSDFTHYGESFGYVPFRDNLKDNIKKLDDGAITEIINISPEGFHRYINSTGATICGYKPILLLLHLLKKEGITSKGVLLNYYTSGDLTGDYRHSVSYASICFILQEVDNIKDKLDETEQKTLLALSRETIRLYLKSQKTPKVDDKKLTSRLLEKRGVFVTLKKHGHLRGCIGSIFEPKPLYEGVIEQTINSAVKDWRFSPVTLDEEKELNIEISVLSPMRKVKGPEEIVVGEHGVYLIKGNASAVFLPQVAPEQGWTREEMLNHLSEKAGLPKDAWRKDAEFLVFTAQVFSE